MSLNSNNKYLFNKAQWSPGTRLQLKDIICSKGTKEKMKELHLHIKSIHSYSEIQMNEWAILRRVFGLKEVEDQIKSLIDEGI